MQEGSPVSNACLSPRAMKASTIIIISLYLSLFLSYSCSNKQKTSPSEQSIEVVKPIKTLIPQDVKIPLISQEVKPKPEEKEVKEEKRLESVFSEPQTQVARIEKFKEINDIQFSRTQKGEDMVTFFLWDSVFPGPLDE